MVNTIQMTQTGYDELAKELEELKTTKRSEIAENKDRPRLRRPFRKQ